MRTSIRNTILAVAVICCCSSTAFSQWREVQIPQPYADGYYLDVFFLPSNPDLGWACSMEGHIVRTTDAGRTWRGFTIPGAFLEYVQFVNPQTGFTSGQGGVFRSDDGGASWIDITPTPMVQEKGWGSYWLNDRVGVYLVGGCASSRQAFYRTSDGGRTWSVFYGNELQSGLSDALLYDDGTGWAVSSGVLWRTEDFARTWYRFSYTGPRYWTEEIAVAGRSILLPTSGQDCDGQSRNVGSLRFSRDGGVSWDEFQTRQNMFGTFLLTERVGWGVGDNRTVLYTEDAGRSWTLRNCGIRGNIDDIYFINDTLGWAVGQGIYRSNFNSSNSSITITPPEPVVRICPGDSLYVEARGPFGEYRWNDNVVATGRVLRDTGTYIVRAYDSLTCVFVADTIRLLAKSAFRPIITASKTAICEGDSATLTVNGPVRSQRWNTGDTTTSIVVLGSGPYTCTIIDSAGCTTTTPALSIVVNKNPRPTITANRSVVMCLDDTVQLSTSEPYATYAWSTGATSSMIRVSSSGRYFLTVADRNGCVGGSDTVEVTVLNTRNKTEIQFDAGSPGVVTLISHEVGELVCRDLLVRNRSTTESLIIPEARFVGNVYFSAPQSQFPVAILPAATAVIRVCASAQDLGKIRDTLVIQDTCSAVIVPFETQGDAIELTGKALCDIDVHTTIYRAGSAWRLRAPFPVPAATVLKLGLTPPSGYEAEIRVRLQTAHGDTVREVVYKSEQGAQEVSLQVSGVQTGMYLLSVDDADGHIATYPVIVVQ